MIDQWIAIFRTGTHTDSSGRPREFTKEDLDRMVEKYVPSSHEAPVVIGHPKDNAPAFGWVETIKREGEILYARLKDLVPEFVDMVRRGLFKKRSISLYPDDTLRHIGFLGANPPAVKGLPDVAFKGDESTLSLYEFASTEEEKAAQKTRSKRYGIGIKEGGAVTKPTEWADVPDDDFLDPVNYRYPCPDADQTRAAASYWGQEKNKQQYSPAERAIIDRRLEEKKKKFKIGEQKANKGGSAMSIKDTWKAFFNKAIDDLPEDGLPEETPRTYSEAELKAKADEAAEKARKEAKETADKEYAEKQKKERLDRKAGEVKAYVEDLAKKGQVIPAWQKMGLVEFMTALDDEETIEFAEKTEKISRLGFFKKLLEEIPKMVEFKEIATRDKETPSEFMGLVEQYEKDKKLTHGQAIAFAAREHPEAHQEWITQANAR